MNKEMAELLEMVENSVRMDGERAAVVDEGKLRQTVHLWAEVSALGTGARQGWARWLVRAAALDLGIVPASIHELYMARGRGQTTMTWATPAFNLRALPFHCARAMFRAAHKIDAGAFIFEIARSEIGYTEQRPAEYATNILAAAIAEGFRGPLFLQGDHFQVSAKRYASAEEAEISALRDLIHEAIAAGFFNIDIDTSTLVDISKPTVPEQQKVNVELSAMFSAHIRALEPQDVTISIGGEIGEVGGHNSTEEELRAFMDGYNAGLARLTPGAVGLSKISIQTGTSHGGVVLSDGSIAKVKLDFDTLCNLSRVARSAYNLGGTVQHGASTLPEEMFNKFVEFEAVEVHLATNFMNMFYDLIPADLRREMYAWLDVNSAAERKTDMTDQQFYYKARKNAIGPFKSQTWALPQTVKDGLCAAWEAQFDKLFHLLGVAGTRSEVEKYIRPVAVYPKPADYLGEAAGDESVSDLAD